MNGYEEVIAAFLDDERVEATTLQEALALPEGREYLVEMLALRELVNPRDRDVAPAPARPAGVDGGGGAGSSSIWQQGIRRWAVAAVAVILASVGGYFAGVRGAFPARIEGAGSSVEVVADKAVPIAPKPTHRIRLEPGVNWSASEGR